MGRRRKNWFWYDDDESDDDNDDSGEYDEYDDDDDDEYDEYDDDDDEYDDDSEYDIDDAWFGDYGDSYKDDDVLDDTDDEGLDDDCDGEYDPYYGINNAYINSLPEEDREAMSAWLALQKMMSEGRKKEREEQERQERARQEAERKRKESIMNMEVPLDLVNLFATDTRAEGVHADSPADGLILSLTNLGRVDIEYIAQITGEDYRTVITELRGSIYQNPDTWGECFYKGWETADEYLSGNLVRKLRRAKAENEKFVGYFSMNIEALERAMPEKLSKGDIYVTLGSPWVPEDVIEDFMTYIFGKRRYYGRDWEVKRDEYTGTWEIADKRMYSYSVKISETYGTRNMNGLELLEKTLNMKSATVYKEVASDKNKSGIARVLDKDETVAAMDKQKLMISIFTNWVWKDKARAERLEDIYESRYSCVRKRTFDGSFLKFPGMSDKISLYKYQRDAVARIILTPNTLLAHEVGAGKTFIMAAAGMEMKRMGLSSKNMYVVPNNILGQWDEMFHLIYPGADVMVCGTKDFTPAKRHDTMVRIRDEEHDAIIIPYSSFTSIPVSREYEIESLQEEIAKIDEVDDDSATQKLRYRRTMLAKKLQKLLDGDDSDDSDATGGAYGSGGSGTGYSTGSGTGSGKKAKRSVQKGDIYFDELGVTRLFVDEAHNFKNLPIDTNIDRVLGINPTGSVKCTDMLKKVDIVQKANNGGGVIMATGTPITNSVTDVFVMQKYLQSGELALSDLQNFDSWVAMFGEKVTDFEIDVDTSGYRLATRFARFHNIPELTALLSSIADFHKAEGSDGIPVTDGYTDCVIRKTPEFNDYLKEISARADKVRAGRMDRHKDNMLMITTDGRRAALDLRLVLPDAKYTACSKVAECAENVYYVYTQTKDICGTQLVFCDTSTPKDKFNIYDELKRLLVEKGVPEGEIAYIHDAQSDLARTRLFEEMRCGRVRIMIGSTFKMGLGMNVQDHLIAVHHIDIPWRPADMVQREGRILRPGNLNPKVYIYRYITEGSFDAYSWQLLETKQRFISELLSGAYAQRSGGDIKDAVLDYAEVKALAVGNPLLKERVETANELTRLLTLKRRYVDDRLRMEQQRAGLPEQINGAKKRAANCEDDIKWYASARAENADLDQWREEKKARAKQAAAERAEREEKAKQEAAAQAAAVQEETPATEQAETSVTGQAETSVTEQADIAAEQDTAQSQAVKAIPEDAASLNAAEDAASLNAAADTDVVTEMVTDTATDTASDTDTDTATTELYALDTDADAEAEMDDVVPEDTSALSAEEKARDAAFRERDKALQAERKLVREQLYAAISAYDYSTSEEFVISYMGFGIYLPSGMSALNPYVWLKRSGKYRVELGKGDKDKGYLVRIDNCLADLDKTLERFKGQISDLTRELKDLEAELAKDKDYDGEISNVQIKLEAIDRMLGIKD